MAIRRAAIVRMLVPATCRANHHGVNEAMKNHKIDVIYLLLSLGADVTATGTATATMRCMQ